MEQNQADVRRGQVERRAERLAKPREPRMGKIKLGYLAHKCRGCGKIWSAATEKCPSCAGTDWTQNFPRKTNHYVFFGDGTPSEGHKRFGEAPTVIPCTFKNEPADNVMVRRECYQGGKLYCVNPFTVNRQTGEYRDLKRAFRRGDEIKCDPTSCPYVMGGTVTGPDGQSKRVNPGQCGETVTMSLWLPDVPGFDAYLHKSGSIETINNMQTAVKTLTAMASHTGQWYPLKLEMRLKEVHSSYPDSDGQMKKTQFFSTILHWPQSVTDLQDKATRGKLVATDMAYILPADLFGKRALPQPTEDSFDPLIDGSRGKPELPEPKGTDIADLDTREHPVAKQADRLTKAQGKSIKDGLEIIDGLLTQDAQENLRKEICKTWGVTRTKTGGLVLGKLTGKRAGELVLWLARKVDQINVKEDGDGG